MQSATGKDARYFQISFQLFLLSYGIIFLGWQTDWRLYLTYLSVSVVTQLSFELIRGKTGLKQRLKYSLPSVMISSLGLCLLLKTSNLSVATLAAFVSIASKFIIQFRGKHIFNPSALGIACAVLFTGKAWISPGQWGSGIFLLLMVCCLGIIVVTKVQKLDTSLTFLISFAALLFIRQIMYLGWPLDYFIQSISTGSLLIFSFFMISDPKTTPNNSATRIIWSITVAVTAFYCSTFQFINAAPIWALVLLQPLVPILDALIKGEQFKWKNELSTGYMYTNKLQAGINAER